MDRRHWTMMMGGALLLCTSGCVRSVWFTQPLRETYEIGVVASPMGGDAIDLPEGERTPEPADAEEGGAGDVEPATPADVAPNELPARSPDQLQYFVSERLVLQREATSRDGAVTQGRIKVRRGRFIEQVVVPRKTPGVAVDWGDDWVAISFEADSAVVFALDGNDGSPMAGDVYHLRTRTDPAGGPTTVSMRGELYEVRRGHNAKLMVRRESKTKRARRRRVMRGRTLE